jgi:hypothetical protein
MIGSMRGIKRMVGVGLVALAMPTVATATTGPDPAANF